MPLKLRKVGNCISPPRSYQKVVPLAIQEKVFCSWLDSINVILHDLRYYFLFQIREEAAIRELVTVAKETRTGGPAEGAHLHIVHLSDSSSSLDLIKVLFYMHVAPVGYNAL
jgi:hypothetical protein